MKRAIPVIMLAFLSISMIILTLRIEPIKAAPRTWTVDDDGPADFHTIQEAVDAANLGDVVFVYGGTYSENVIIEKPLKLVGENPEMTVVTGGFLVEFTHTVSISDFKMIGGNYGVQLCASYNNSITNNLITGARVGGIYFNYTDYPSLGGKGNNIVTLNTIWNNSCGIVAWVSSDNIIHHNNFDNHGQQVISYDSINVWDDGYPSGGNYWSDYVCIDEKNGLNQDQQGSDGIGDTPYIINAANLDHYPLMNLWTQSKTTVEANGEEYSVTLVSNTAIDQIVTTPNTLDFTVSGPSGEKGHMLVIFPAINTTTIKVFVDGQELVPPPFPTINTNGTHYFIYFEFNLSIHEISIEFAPVNYTLTITTTTGGTTNPVPGTYTYAVNSTVQVTAIPDANYLFDHWELGGINVGSTNAYMVLMDKNYTLKAIFSPVPQPLSTSISPLSASINVGQSITFISTVTGGTTPYSYQWYLNSVPVSGATAASWTFTPNTSGIYYLYLKVTDSSSNTTLSETARVTVASVPVGGYSVSIEENTTAKHLTPYIALIATLTMGYITIKRKTQRRID